MDDLWRELSLGQKSSVMATDPTLRYFEQSTVEAVALGNSHNFTIEKVTEIQDRVTTLAPSADVSKLKKILTGKPRVRAHKLTQAIVERLTELAENPDAIDTSAPPPAYTSYANQDQIPEPISATTSPTHHQLPQDGSPQRPAMAPTSAQAPAPTNVQSSEPHQQQQQQEQKYLMLNPDVNGNALVNVRAAPDSNAESVGTITHATGPVAVCAFEGDWARLGDGSPDGAEAWVLRFLPEGGPVRELFVEVRRNDDGNEEATPTPPQPPAVSTNSSRPATPALPSPTSSTTTAAAPRMPVPVAAAHMAVPMTAVAAPPPSQFQAPTLAALAAGDVVTRQEHDTLRHRVAQLEDELRRISTIFRTV